MWWRCSLCVFVSICVGDALANAIILARLHTPYTRTYVLSFGFTFFICFVLFGFEKYKIHPIFAIRQLGLRHSIYLLRARARAHTIPLMPVPRNITPSTGACIHVYSFRSVFIYSNKTRRGHVRIHSEEKTHYFYNLNNKAKYWLVSKSICVCFILFLSLLLFYRSFTFNY